MGKLEPIIAEALREYNLRREAIRKAAALDPILRPFLEAYLKADLFPAWRSEGQLEIAEDAAHELLPLVEDIVDELVTDLARDA